MKRRLAAVAAVAAAAAVIKTNKRPGEMSGLFVYFRYKENRRYTNADTSRHEKSD
jgi:hypothetical protein